MQLIKWMASAGLSLTLLMPAYAVEDAFWLDISNDRTASVLRYLAQGVDPNVKSREELPAVMWAIQNESWGVYDLLVEHRRFDPNMTNANNETPLMYLAIMGETKRAADLIARGAEVNRLGWTPLHYAASKKQIPVATLLLEKGAIVNAPAPDGTTPLMMAARSGSRDMVNVLLEKGADPTTLSLTKLSAADWAETNKQSRLAAELRQISQDYQQQRIQQQGNVSPIVLGVETVSEQDDTTKSSDHAEPASTSQRYFDLKRFE